MTPAERTAERTDERADHATRFGDRRVAAADKARLVRRVFDSVAPRYDLMNDLMSAGLHRLWKRELAALVARDIAGGRAVDVAGGTGDVAFLLARRGVRVDAIDVNAAMLARGRDRALDRARDRSQVGAIGWLCGDAEALPLADASVGAYTIAFGIRNVTHLDRALAEAHRVLRPGGRFACLEFGHLALPALDGLYGRTLETVLPRLGAVVAGDGDAYRYLAQSIRRFPSRQRFAAMVAAAGFAHIATRNLSGGIAAITAAWRL